MKIGLMGGTFDPIHLGHLITAQEIQNALGLDKVIFIPSSTPPHKTVDEKMILHRKEMAMLALLSNPDFEVSDYEVEKGGISYTIDTIRYMKKSMGAENEFFFIVGSDAFYDLIGWKDAPEQFNECHFVVATRGNESIQKKLEFLNVRVAKRFPKYYFKSCQEQNEENYRKVSVENTGKCLFFLTTPRIDISSTEIRERVQSGYGINYLVPDAVGEYIKREGLYRPEPLSNK